jgi:cell fate (sporulation/competence/biofilm development) regulator YlbF (YheA/YmcA/DUF963 family)
MANAALVEAQRVEVQYAEPPTSKRVRKPTRKKAPIEANRSLVELQTEQQRLRSQLGDLQKQEEFWPA